MPYIIYCHGKYIHKDDSLRAMMHRGGLTASNSKSSATRFASASIARAYAADWESVEYGRGNNFKCKIIAVS